MNCPSHTDYEFEHEDWNQNPPSLSGDTTTRQDLNGIINLRSKRESDSADHDGGIETRIDTCNDSAPGRSDQQSPLAGLDGAPPDVQCKNPDSKSGSMDTTTSPAVSIRAQKGRGSGWPCTAWAVLIKFSKFIGPGFMVAVAYIDPGNYATDVAAGASTKFGLLFIVFMSNVFAILLQSLAIRLGTVTGLNLAEQCRAQLPRWLNISLYILGEAAIIATDIAEVRNAILPAKTKAKDERSLVPRLRSISY